MSEREKEKRRSVSAREAADIGVGIVIVVLSILTFLNADQNRAVFPVIFLLGAGLCLSNAFDEKEKRLAGRNGRLPETLLFTGAAALFMMAALSAASVLWG